MTTRGGAAPSRHRGLAWIAVFKLAKACALLVLGAYTLDLTRAVAMDHLVALVARLPLAPGARPLVHFVDWFAQLGPRHVAVAGIALLGYATLYAVEGVGLWLGKRWAEYLTVIATASLIPFEVWELTRGVSGLKVIALVLNIVIVAYLVRVIALDRKSMSA
jgi:uncharacterized membrane protein (DUF2068 family)